MNKIFRVIWNHSTQTWTAVSELAKGKVKSSSIGDVQTILASESTADHPFKLKPLLSALLPGSTWALLKQAVLFGVLIASSQSVSSAEIIQNGGKIGEGTVSYGRLSGKITSQGGNSILLGDAAGDKVGQSSTVVGMNGSEAPRDQSVAVGSDVHAKGSQSTAIGNNAYSSGFGSIVIGGDDVGGDIAIVTNGGDVVGYYPQCDAKCTTLPNPIYFVDNKTNVTSDVQAGRISASERDVFIVVSSTGNPVYYKVNRNNNKEIVYNSNSKRNDVYTYSRLVPTQVLEMYRTTAKSNDTFGRDRSGSKLAAIQPKSVSKYGNAWAPSWAAGRSSIVLGPKSIAFGDGAVAIGTTAYALGNGSTVVGSGSFAFGDNSQAIGNQAYVFNKNSVGVGTGVQTLADGAMSYGYRAVAAGEGSLAIGSEVYADAKLSLDGRIRYNNSDFIVHRRLDSTTGGELLGYQMSTTRLKAGDNGHFAYGNYKAGPYIDALEEIISSEAALAPISKLNEGTGIIQIESEPDSKNSIVIGSRSASTGANNIVIGRGSFARAPNSMAIGSYSYTLNENALAVGLASRAFGKNSMAIGVGTAVDSGGESSTVVGYASYAKDKNSAIFGANSTTSTPNSIIFGNDSEVSTNDSLAIGNRARATRPTTGANRDQAANMLAIGNDAIANMAFSTAIGYGSKTDYNPADLSEPGWAPRNTVSLPSSSNVGLISVGSKGQERRIINVAAGYRDTDAVNVSQLKSLEDRMDAAAFEEENRSIHYFSVAQNDNPANNYNAAHLAQLERREQVFKRYVKLRSQELLVKARQKQGADIDPTYLTKLEADVRKTETELGGKTGAFLRNKQLNNDNLIEQRGTNPSTYNLDTAVTAIENARTADESSGALSSAEKAELKKHNFNNQGAEGQNSIAVGYNARTSAPASKSVAIGYDASSQGASSVVLGESANAVRNHGIAIGANANVSGTSGIVLGHNSKIANIQNYDQGITNGIAIGKDASIYTDKNSQSSIAIGDEARIGALTSGKNSHRALAIGHRARSFSGETVVIGLNAEAGSETLAGNTPSNYVEGWRSVVIGAHSKSLSEKGTVVGQNAQIENGSNESIAIGSDTKVTGNSPLSIAIGQSTQAKASYATAVGQGSLASADSSTALGRGAGATAGNATAVGRGASAGADDATALGRSASASAKSALAAGHGASSTVEGGVALGQSASATVTNSVALGANSNTAGASAVQNYTLKNMTFGNFAGGTNSGNDKVSGVVSVGKSGNGGFTRQIQNVAAGRISDTSTDAVNGSQLFRVIEKLPRYISINGTNTDADSNIANNRATGEDDIAIGSSVSATAGRSVVIGNRVSSEGFRSVVIGSQSNVTSTARNSVVIGGLSQSSSQSSVAIGDGASVSGTRGISIGFTANATMENAVALGKNAQAKGSQAVAVGAETQATNTGASAFGESAQATGERATGLGNNARATAGFATAVGYLAKAEANESVAIGSRAEAKAARAVAVGNSTQATQEGAAAFGDRAKATGKNSLALGALATAGEENSVALGHQATTSAKNAVSNISYKNDAGAEVTSNFAGTGNSVVGVVSVGKADQQRQIQNVAAGKISSDSTDAINGSQLHDVITNLGFNVQQAGTNKARINNNGFVNFVNGDYTKAKVENSGDGSTVQINVDQTPITHTNGVASANGNGLAKSSEVVAAINNSGFYVNSNGTNTAKTFVKSGGDLNINKGKNIEIARSGSTLTISTSENPVFTTAKVTQNPTDNQHVVNKGYLDSKLDSVSGSWELQVDGEANKLTVNKTSNLVKFKAGDNANVSRGSGNTVTFAVSKTPEFTTVKTGDLTATGNVNLGGNGKNVTVVAGTNVNFNNSAIDNLGSAGTISATNKKAVNAADLHQYVSEQIQNANTNINNNLGNQRLRLGGNNAEGDATKLVSRALNQSILIVGEGTQADDKYDGSLVKTVSDNTSGKITVKISKNPTFDSLTSKGGLTVHGASTLNATTVKQGLTVQGATTLNATTVKQNLTVEGDTKLGAAGKKVDLNGSNLTNVASGSISANSKDGVNGGDVFTHVKGKIEEVENKGLKFKGDDGTAFTVKLGDSFTIEGNASNTASSDFSNKNVRTKTVDNGKKVQIEISDKPNFKKVTVSEELDATGATTKLGTTQIQGDLTSSGNVTLGGAGKTVTLNSDLNANNKKITNLADPTEQGDAVNLKKAQELADAAKNAALQSGFALVGNNNVVIKKPLGESIAIEGDAANANEDNSKFSTKNVRTRADNGKLLIELSTSPEFANATITNNLSVAGATSVKDLTANGDVTLGGQGKTVTIAQGTTGVDFNNVVLNNVGSAGTLDANNKKAVNAADVFNYADPKFRAVNSTIENLTFNIGGNDAATNTVNRKLTETIVVKGEGVGADTDYDGSLVRTFGNNASGEIVVKISKNPTFESLTSNGTLTVKGATTLNETTVQKGLSVKETLNVEGDTTLNKTTVNGAFEAKDNVTLGGQGKQLNVVNGTTIDFGNNTITNLGEGQVNATSTEAVRGKDVHKAIQEATAALNGGVFSFIGNNVSTVVTRNLGQTLAIQGAGALEDSEYSADNVKTVGSQDGGIQIRIAKNPTFDNVAVKENLSVAGTTTLNTTAISGNLTSTGNVTLGGAGQTVKIVNGSTIDAGNNQIKNVANGTDASDAATLGQTQKLVADAKGEAVALGFALIGNDNQVIKQNLGNSISVVGADANAGADKNDKFSTENVRTRADNGKLLIEISKNPSFDNVSVRNDLTVNGTTTLNTTTVKGDATFDKDLTVNGTTTLNTTTIKGDTTVEKDLTVNGTTTLNTTTIKGDTTVEKDLTVNGTTTLNTTTIKGDTTVEKDLTVNGTTTLNTTTIKGDTTVEKDLTVNGTTTLNTTTIKGDTTVEKDLTVNGTTTLNTTTIKGDTTVEKNLTVNGTTTLNTTTIKGDTKIEKTLTVDGATVLNTTTVNGDLTATGNATLGGDGKTVTFANGTTIDLGGNKLTNITSGTGDNDVASVGHVNRTITETIKTLTSGGLKFSGNVDKDGNPITTALGETLYIIGAGAEDNPDFSSSNVRTRTQDGKVYIEISTKPSFAEVTTDTLTVGKEFNATTAETTLGNTSVAEGKEFNTTNANTVLGNTSVAEGKEFNTTNANTVLGNTSVAEGKEFNTTNANTVLGNTSVAEGKEFNTTNANTVLGNTSVAEGKEFNTTNANTVLGNTSVAEGKEFNTTNANTVLGNTSVAAGKEFNTTNANTVLGNTSVAAGKEFNTTNANTVLGNTSVAAGKEFNTTNANTVLGNTSVAAGKEFNTTNANTVLGNTSVAAGKEFNTTNANTVLGNTSVAAGKEFNTTNANTVLGNTSVAAGKEFNTTNANTILGDTKVAAGKEFNTTNANTVLGNTSVAAGKEFNTTNANTVLGNTSVAAGKEFNTTNANTILGDTKVAAGKEFNTTEATTVLGTTTVGGEGKSFTVANGTTIDMGGNVISNITTGTGENDVASVGHVTNTIANSISNLTNQGLKFSGNIDQGTEVEPNKPIKTTLGDTLYILGQGDKDSVDFSGSNVRTRTENGTVYIELSTKPSFAEVTTDTLTVGKEFNATTAETTLGNTSVAEGKEFNTTNANTVLGNTSVAEGKEFNTTNANTVLGNTSVAEGKEFNTTNANTVLGNTSVAEGKEFNTTNANTVLGNTSVAAGKEFNTTNANTVLGNTSVAEGKEFNTTNANTVLGNTSVAEGKEFNTTNANTVLGNTSVAEGKEFNTTNANTVLGNTSVAEGKEFNTTNANTVLGNTSVAEGKEFNTTNANTVLGNTSVAEGKEFNTTNANTVLGNTSVAEGKEFNTTNANTVLGNTSVAAGKEFNTTNANTVLGNTSVAAGKEFNTTNANTVLGNTSVAEGKEFNTTNANTVLGDTKVAAGKEFNTTNANTVLGDTKVAAGKEFNTTNANTVLGNTSVAAGKEFNTTNANTVLGDTSVAAGKEFNTTNANTVLGNTSLATGSVFNTSEGKTVLGTTVVGGDGKSFNILGGTTIDLGGNKISNITTGTDPNDVASVGHVTNSIANSISNLTSQGLKFSGNIDKDGKPMKTALGDTVYIVGEGDENSEDFNGSNVRTRTDHATGKVHIEIATKPTFDEVTTDGLVVKKAFNATNAETTLGNTTIAAGKEFNTANANTVLGNTRLAEGKEFDTRAGMTLLGNTKVYAGYTFDAFEAKTILGDTTIGGEGKKLEVKPGTEIDMGGNELANIKSGKIESGNNSAVTGDAVKQALVELIQGGMIFVGNDGEVKVNLNSPLNIKGGAKTEGTYSSDNVRTEASEDGGIEIKFADRPTFESVAVKGALTAAGDVTLGGGENTTFKIVEGTKIDLGGNKLSNVGKGSIAEGSTDGVNGDDVFIAIRDSNKALTDSGLKFAGNNNQGNPATTKLGDTFTIIGGANNADPAGFSAKNVRTEVRDSTVEIQLSERPSFTEVAATDRIGIANGPTLSGTGLNMANTVITGLADGKLAANSTDAVTGGQLHTVSSLVDKGWELEIGVLEGTNGITNKAQSTRINHSNKLVLNAGQNIALTQDAGTISIATVTNPTFDNFFVKPNGHIDMGGSRVQNVGAPRLATDATNKGYVDKLVRDMNVKMHRLDRTLSAGIAGSTAIAFLQTPNLAGKQKLSVAVGGYRGESALAVGYAGNSDNNRISVRFGLSMNSRKDVSYGGSLGYQW